jgi:hypothetical protein
MGFENLIRLESRYQNPRRLAAASRLILVAGSYSTLS